MPVVGILAGHRAGSDNYKKTLVNFIVLLYHSIAVLIYYSAVGTLLFDLLQCGRYTFV